MIKFLARSVVTGAVVYGIGRFLSNEEAKARLMQNTVGLLNLGLTKVGQVIAAAQAQAAASAATTQAHAQAHAPQQAPYQAPFDYNQGDKY